MARMQKEKIELYVQRSFGEKFSATFDFVSENWRVMSRFLIYFMLPFSLLMALSMNTLTGSMLDFSSTVPAEHEYIRMGMSYLWLVLVAVCAYLVLGSLVYAMMRLYFKRKDGLEGLAMGELWPDMRYCLKRYLAVALACLLVMAAFVSVCVLLALLSPALALVPYFAFLVCALPLALFAPTCMFERIPVFVALGKAMRLGFKTWGGVFAVCCVVGVIVYVMAMVVSIPWTICYVVKIFLVVDASVVDSAGFAGSVGFELLMFLFAAINALGSFLGSAVLLVAMGFQYGHAAEKVDGMSVAQDVERFESLADVDAAGRWGKEFDTGYNDFEKL